MKTRKTSKKMRNSYTKIILGLLAGALIGGILGFGSSFLFSGRSLQESLKTAAQWIGNQLPILLSAFAVLSLFICNFVYRKCESLIRLDEASQTEEEHDLLDARFDLWNTIGCAGSNILMILPMIFFAFITCSSTLSSAYLVKTVLPFLACCIICTFYQVAMVKQMQRKDPSKKGDAADLNFQKTWLASCDEAEKEIIYQSSYHTVQFMKTFLLILFVIALLAQTLLETGLLAVICLGVTFAAMLTAYSIYTLKLQKKHLRS